MISTAVLEQVEERISFGESPNELTDDLAQLHGLTDDESAAVWLYGAREAQDPGHRVRALRARERLTPIG